MFYIFEVRDDENMSIPTQEFETFANAFDYAQDGTTTVVYRIPLIGDDPDYDEAEQIWDWSEPADRDSLVKLFDGVSPAPLEGTTLIGNREDISDFDFQRQCEEEPEFCNFEKYSEYLDANNADMSDSEFLEAFKTVLKKRNSCKK